jgi:hypothetical protein
MEPRNLESYGGPFQNEEAVVDPVSEVDAPFFDRALCDVAQLTVATGFTWFSFITTATAAPVTVDAANVSASGVWGNGSPAKPTVEKTAPGVYTLTWASEFDDELVGVDNMTGVEETQSVAFTYASGLNVLGATNGHARVSAIASNVVTVRVYDDAAPEAASDLGGTATISGYLR